MNLKGLNENRLYKMVGKSSMGLLLLNRRLELSMAKWYSQRFSKSCLVHLQIVRSSDICSPTLHY